MSDFEFKVAGLSEDDEIIFLVDDHQHGKCSYAIKETVDEKTQEIKIASTFLHETDKAVPEERQEQIIVELVNSIIKEVEKNNSVD